MTLRRKLPLSIWSIGARRGVSFVAFLAIALFLIGPVCTAWQTVHAGEEANAGPAHEHPDTEVCCTSLTDALVLPSGTVAVFTADPGSGELTVPLAQVARSFAPASLAVLQAPPQSPPRSLPYHARTARILA